MTAPNAPEQRQVADYVRPYERVVPPELVSEAEKTMAALIFWEPFCDKLSALEFRCLVKRMLFRLEKRGYELRQIDGPEVGPCPVCGWLIDTDECRSAPEHNDGVDHVEG